MIGMGFADTVENEAIMRECDGNFEEAVGRLETRREARGMAAPVITREQNRERQDEMEVRHGFLADMGVALAQVRRSMHQDCLLNPRNFVFYPIFTHFPPSFAHFQRLDARNPENTTRSPGENGKKSRKIGENGGN